MKRSNLAILLTATVLFAGAGCKKNPKPLTDIPGRRPELPETGTMSKPIGTSTGPGQGGRFTTNPPQVNTLNGIGENGDLSRLTERPPEGGLEDSEKLRPYTVYFDFDRAAIKPDQRANLEEVAAWLKNNPNTSLKIEGHCDERGTEEYNRALGERRAIAARDYLIQVHGIDSARLTTVSFGEDKPAVQGQDEAAYTQNRRDQFVVLTPQ